MTAIHAPFDAGKSRIFIGYDSSQDIAYRVLKHSFEHYSSIPLDIRPLNLKEITATYNWQRENDPLQSTEFTYTRFLIPYICGYSGVALFVDCDMLCMGDVAELFALDMASYALRVVKHDYRPTATVKMGGKVQTSYPRKNWSSLMMMNCAKLNVWSFDNVRTKPGSFLHRFEGIPDSEIGDVPATWNTLDIADASTKLIHYTSGGPWLKGCENHEYGHLWLNYKQNIYRA